MFIDVCVFPLFPSHGTQPFFGHRNGVRPQHRNSDGLMRAAWRPRTHWSAYSAVSQCRHSVTPRVGSHTAKRSDSLTWYLWALESPGKPWNLESFTRTQPVGLGFCIDPAPCIGFHVRRLLMLAGPVRLWKLQSLSPFLLIHGDGGCNIGSSALLNDLMDLNGM